MTIRVVHPGIIRSWGRIASSSDAFGLLRVLNCRSQSHITSDVFSHFNQFPALSLFNVEDCNLGPGDGQAARSHGWNFGVCGYPSDLPVTWDAIVQASFRLAGAISGRTLTAEGVDFLNAIPMLHMAVGATQPDVLVDAARGRCLRSFSRERVDMTGSWSKNHLIQTLAPSIKISHCKPSLRASKQQNMVDFMAGFGRGNAKS